MKGKKISSEGATAVSRLLRNSQSSLRVLKCARNNIGFEGVRHVAAALLMNNTLFELDLGGINYMTIAGAVQLGQALAANVTVEWLKVGEHRISISAIRGRPFINSLAVGHSIILPPTTLDLKDYWEGNHLKQTYSGMHDEMAIVIVTLLKDNEVLQTLKLHDNGAELPVQKLIGRPEYVLFID